MQTREYVFIGDDGKKHPTLFAKVESVSLRAPRATESTEGFRAVIADDGREVDHSEVFERSLMAEAWLDEKQPAGYRRLPTPATAQTLD